MEKKAFLPPWRPNTLRIFWLPPLKVTKKVCLKFTKIVSFVLIGKEIS